MPAPPLGLLMMCREDVFYPAAHVGSRPEFIEFLRSNPIPLSAVTSGMGRAAAERRSVLLADITDDARYRDGNPHRRAAADIEGIRSAVWVPMVKNDKSVGVICLYRREVRPFDESHVALVSTFADQAVIAIDNVRLFQELERRNTETLFA